MVNAYGLCNVVCVTTEVQPVRTRAWVRGLHAPELRFALGYQVIIPSLQNDPPPLDGRSVSDEQSLAAPQDGGYAPRAARPR